MHVKAGIEDEQVYIDLAAKLFSFLAVSAFGAFVSVAEPILTDEELRLSQINASVVENVRVNNAQSVTIVSKGGLPQDFLLLAEKLSAADAHLQFPGLCLSACAEHLITLDLEKTLGSRTLIAYHYNSTIFNYLARRSGVAAAKNCFQENANRAAAHLEKNGRNLSFWKHQFNYLDHVRTELIDPDECKFAHYFRNQWWIPSSDQLARLHNLETDTDICNDDLACTKLMSNLFMDDGDQFVFHETRLTFDSMRSDDQNKREPY